MSERQDGRPFTVTFEDTPLLVGDNDDQEFPPVIHRDSEWSVNSQYTDDEEHNSLTWIRASTLLTAEMMGTGLLALPYAVNNIGFHWGIGFLILNIPINYYAGWILHHTANFIERQQERENRIFTNERQQLMGALASGPNPDNIALNQDTLKSMDTKFSLDYSMYTAHTRLHHDSATFDFIGMSTAVFQDNNVTRLVMWIYYSNIFLVLGNYMLVQARSLAAAIGEDRICLPTAGLLACVGMFVVTQFRTMVKLAQSASIVSLVVLFVVIMQCLWEIRSAGDVTTADTVAVAERASFGWETWLQKLSATGSIGFAVGSQKLFLNVRHELRDRSEAPRALGISLVTFGSGYALICVLAGPNPPSFLFDAIPRGSWNRHVAGVMLWIHVVVSYAINSQAICSSMDRLLWNKLFGKLHRSLDDAKPATRWFALTFLMAVSSYFAANVIPFFKDLVSLIGALTAVPLTLLLPACLWRRHLNIPLLTFIKSCLASSALTYYSLIFMVLATTGCIYSIQKDWSNQSGPFACHS